MHRQNFSSLSSTSVASVTLHHEQQRWSIQKGPKYPLVGRSLCIADFGRSHGRHTAANSQACEHDAPGRPAPGRCGRGAPRQPAQGRRSHQLRRRGQTGPSGTGASPLDDFHFAPGGSGGGEQQQQHVAGELATSFA